MSVPSAHDLFPDLSTASTTERACYLRDGATSTFVVPGDWVPDDEASQRVHGYGHQSLLGDTTDVWHNEVEFFVGGRDTYASIGQDIRAAMDAGGDGFVLHVGWTCWRATGLTRRSTYETLIQELVSRGVPTRTLYWAGSGIPSDLALERGELNASASTINAMTPSGVARAYVDNRTKRFGSHHQKIWVILGNGGLSAFFGGVDVHPNRILPGTDFKDPWHDVHGRVRGPAAERFLGIVLWRLMAAMEWGSQPVPAPEATPPAPPPAPLPGEVVGSVERPHPTELHAHQVSVNQIYQIWNRYKSRSGATRHFGGRNPARMHAGATVGNPQLERAGFQSEIHFMVHNGIEQARRFVYVEDQYFWHIEMARWLGDRVRGGQIKQLIMVTNVSDGLAEHPPHTRLALQHLAYSARGFTDRILVFERIGTHGRYTHSKMFVYDDVAAHVGSANFNKRGYSHDSESAGLWVDRVTGHTAWHMVGASLARKLRAKLWEKHLGVPTQHLFDGLGATKYWHDLAAQTGTPSALVTGAPAPSVGLVSLDGEPWTRWARRQGSEEPPFDVTVFHSPVLSAEHEDWIIDPV